MSYPPDVTVLTLTPDNPCNTIITRADGSEVYRVNTETGEVPRTFVRNAQGELFASSEWHGVRNDRITWQNNPSVSITHWMKKSRMPFNK